MNSQTRARWLKSILPWHWISSALTLAGLLVFAITGITLNHAASIEAKPAMRSGTLDLNTEERTLLQGVAPGGGGTSQRAALPAALNARLQARTGLGWNDTAEAEWSEDEVYL